MFINKFITTQPKSRHKNKKYNMRKHANPQTRKHAKPQTRKHAHNSARKYQNLSTLKSYYERANTQTRSQLIFGFFCTSFNVKDENEEVYY